MIKNLSEMIRDGEYDIYESESLGLQANIINGKADPEVVTHQDIINCFRDYLNLLNLDDETHDRIDAEIDKTEQFHEDADTLNDVVYDYAPQ